MINKTDTFVECALKWNRNSTCSIKTKIRSAFQLHQQQNMGRTQLRHAFKLHIVMIVPSNKYTCTNYSVPY